eukprot:3330963-Prymnesium_polylepis.1
MALREGAEERDSLGREGVALSLQHLWDLAHTLALADAAAQQPVEGEVEHRIHRTARDVRHQNVVVWVEVLAHEVHARGSVEVRPELGRHVRHGVEPRAIKPPALETPSEVEKQLRNGCES